MHGCYAFGDRSSSLGATIGFLAGLLLVLSVFSHATALAAPVSFAWDYGTSGEAGFAFHCGQQTGRYTLRFDTGNTETYTVSGLTEGATYYCAVAAYDASGAESPYSNEISTVVPFGAPVAGFNPSPTSGAAPLAVTFTDTTTGKVTAWSWDFGDSATSASQNPSHTYANPGTYTVKLTVTGPGGSSTKTASTPIAVTLPAPGANFTMTPAGGTAPLAVAFTDATTGNVTGWVWNFGDGTTSAVQSPSHTYTSAGSYTVTLTATGPGGSSSITASTPITVIPPAPVANFAMTPASGSAPLTVTFTNSTTGTVTAWAWDFGDGTGSTAKSPSHSYGSPGSYTVTLAATGPGGSSTMTASTPITVTAPAPVADFAMTPTSGVAPLSVAFTDATTGIVTSWAWSFGDGTTSADQNPTHTFSTPGSYTVKLTATGPGGSTTKKASTPIKANWPAPQASFTMSPASGTVPLKVAFTNTTTGKVTAWAWDFGDGTSATGKSPKHTYATPGSYTVTLTATGPGGSSTITASTPISATPPAPVANFTMTPASGSAPLTVTFTDTTTGTVTSWAWDFGDGTSSDSESPIHSYANPGSYTVTLTATGPGGSSTKTASTPISVAQVAAPLDSFAMNATSSAAPPSVSVSHPAIGSAAIWSWEIGDRTSSKSRSAVQSSRQLGRHLAKLIAIGPDSNAPDTAATQIALSPVPPAKFVTGSASRITGLMINSRISAVKSPRDFYLVQRSAGV